MLWPSNLRFVQDASRLEGPLTGVVEALQPFVTAGRSARLRTSLTDRDY